MAVLSKVGGEILVNAPAGGEQVPRGIATLANGNFVVTFSTPAGGSNDIYAQIFDPTGTKVGAAFRVNTTKEGDQTHGTVTGLANGGFVITWGDGAPGEGDDMPPGVKAQLFTSAGTKVGTEFLVNTRVTGAQATPVVCSLAAGGFAVAWNDLKDGPAGDVNVKVQLFDVNGNKSGGEILVNGPTDHRRDVDFVAPLTGGGFAVGWTNIEARSRHSVQLFDSNGGKIGSESFVSPLSGISFGGAAASLPGGGLVVVATYETAGQEQVFGQIFDGAGAKVGNAFAVSPVGVFYQRWASVVALSNGNFVAAWTDGGATGPDTSGASVKAQMFDSSGAQLGTEFLVNTTTEGGQDEPKLTALPGSGFAVTWYDTTTDAIAQVFQFDNNGTSGDGGNNIVLGSSGDDALAGNGGNDTLYGASGGDRLEGGTGNDAAWGGDGHDRLYSGSGSDALHGEDGDDKFFLGATLDPGDVVDGGAGSDTLVLAGNYDNLVLLATTITDVEHLRLTAGFSYRLTTNGATVGTGKSFTVLASTLGRSDTLSFDGSAEGVATSRYNITSGNGDDTLAGGAGGDRLLGGGGHDVLLGYSGNDFLSGGRGADRLEFGSGRDTAGSADVLDSTSRGYDTVVGFDGNTDFFDLPGVVTGVDVAITSGRLSEANFNQDLAAAASAGRLLAQHAVLFTADQGAHAGETFLLVDANGIAGYQPRGDFVFRLVTPNNLASLSVDRFV